VDIKKSKVIIDGIRFDSTTNEVITGEKRIRLEPKVIQVLMLLAHNANKTVTNEEILENVWPETIVTSDSISQCISKLRQIFNDNPKQSRIIETIPKRGYRLIAPAQFVDEIQNVQNELVITEKKKSQKIRTILSTIAFLVSVLSIYGSGTSWGIGIAIVVAVTTIVYILSYFLVAISDRPSHNIKITKNDM